jgi:hypothetical protein
MPVTTDELTQALQTLQTLAEGKRTVWGTPIPWIAEPVFASGFVVPLDYGPANQLIIVTYTVPRGYSALICGLVLGYVGGTTALPGQLLFSVDVNNPNPAAVSPAPGYQEKDYGAVPFQLGSLVPGDPWPVEFKHDQGEQIRIKGQAVNTVPVGAGNFLYGALLGFQWPTMGWEG